jgi:hypothetical protein
VFLKEGTVYRFAEAAAIRQETGKNLNEYFKEAFRC